MTFNLLGAWLSDLMEIGVDGVINLIDTGLTAWQINPVVHAMVVEGVCNGIGSVISFLPTIVTLFLFLSIMEDSGYMARVAFVMDKLLRKSACLAAALCLCLLALAAVCLPLCPLEPYPVNGIEK